MSIVRTNRTGNFTVIPNEIINDERLDADCLGLLVYLLSKPPEWNINIHAIGSAKRFGRHGKVCKMLAALRLLGYAELNRFKNGETEWVVTDTPTESHIPKTGICPHSGKPHSESHIPEIGRVYKRLKDNKDYKDHKRLISDDNKNEVEHDENQESKPEQNASGIEPRMDNERMATKSPKRSSQGTRLTRDWTLPDDWADWAVENLGLTKESVKNLAEEFRDYWAALPGQRALKLDWELTFRNRCRQVCEQRARHSERRNYQQHSPIDNSAPAQVRRAVEARARARGEIPDEPDNRVIDIEAYRV